MDRPEVANVANAWIDHCSRASKIRSGRRDEKAKIDRVEEKISGRGDGLASEREGLQLATVAINYITLTER